MLHRMKFLHQGFCFVNCIMLIKCFQHGRKSLSYIKMIILSLILLKLDLIAQLNYPYIVEYKDAWVEKVRTESLRL